MEFVLLAEQTLNGFQLGILLFLLASGLTLVFGVMDFVNLAHGSFYMLGAFLFAMIFSLTGSFVIGVAGGLLITTLVGVLTEVLGLRTLYTRNHLDQVLATFGLILFFNQLVQVIWPLDGLSVPMPEYLDGTLNLGFGINYPVYRIMIIVVGIIVAILLYILVTQTQIGMLLRAGASNRRMLETLGVDVRRLFTYVFGLGALLAGLAGALRAPIISATSGMGEQILILAFVVVVIGGIGSIKGAFIASILTGMIDTLGRSFLDIFLLVLFPPNAAEAAAPALSSMLIYILMAAVLFYRPQGLFPPKHR